MRGPRHRSPDPACPTGSMPAGVLVERFSRPRPRWPVGQHHGQPGGAGARATAYDGFTDPTPTGHRGSATASSSRPGSTARSTRKPRRRPRAMAEVIRAAPRAPPPGAGRPNPRGLQERRLSAKRQTAPLTPRTRRLTGSASRTGRGVDRPRLSAPIIGEEPQSSRDRSARLGRWGPSTSATRDGGRPRSRGPGRRDQAAGGRCLANPIHRRGDGAP